MIDYHKTETIRCALFTEAEGGVFDRYDVRMDVTPDVAISRHVAFEVERSKSRTIVFQGEQGKIPVQGQFLCVPYDIGRQTGEIFAYEHKIYPKTMQIEVTYQGGSAEGFHIRAKYRDSMAKTRVALAIENNSIIPLYDVQSAVIPLRSKIMRWGEEFKDNILIVRLWNNKVLKIEEVMDEMLKTRGGGPESPKEGPEGTRF